MTMLTFLRNCSLPAVLVWAIFLCACSDNEGDKGKTDAAPVAVQEVRQDTMPRLLHAVGNVRPSASVSIVPRVTGEILAVDFKEGQDVTAGQPLIQIDPRPYEAILREKRGGLAKSRAQLVKAQKDQQRYGKLVGGGYVSKDAFEQTATEAAALSATVQADKAAVENAELDLAYCRIIAPISGRIGALKVDKGNMVKSANSEPIVSIDTLSPCYVTFSVPEVHLPVILEHMYKGEVKLTATPLGGSPAAGKLTLVDNNVDEKTGTIRLRGTFDNLERQLWPGQYVEVQLPLGEVKDAIIVPTTAIQTGRDESFIYVAGEDSRADYRKLKVVFENGPESVVQGELKPGEKVIVEGQIRLSPGMPIQIIEQEN